MFVEIAKINGKNENGKALIKVEDVIAIVQQRKHTTKLFDENENLVSETEDAPRFAVLTSTNQTYIVEEDEYNKLKDLLTK